MKKNNIIENIISILDPQSPYFYVEHIKEKELKNDIFISIFNSEEIRNSLELKKNAALKIGYVSKTHLEHQELKELIENEKKELAYIFFINHFLLNEEIDESVFDLIIYDEVCIEDIYHHNIEFHNLKTPRIIFFSEDCQY